MRSLSPSISAFSSLRFQPLTQQRLSRDKFRLKKIKSSEFISKPIQVTPTQQKLSIPSHSDIKVTRRSGDGRLKTQQLASTFGSQNLLNFRSKPLKRKRRKVSPSKTLSSLHITEQSEPKTEGKMAFQAVKQSLFSTKFNSKKVYRITDFIFLQKAGQGTYSEVYKVVEKNLGFVCSLKILSKEKIAKMGVKENVMREIKLSLFLDHPNLISLFGVFSDEKAVYMVGELATDHNLFEAMSLGRNRGQKNMPVEVVREYMGQVCEALRYMHSHMILHRDVKPENILITYTTTVKLCDFGWSVHNPDRALRSTFCGTPLYLAPELIQQNSYDESVDVWATGVVTYELLTGEIPFRIRSVRDLSKVVTDEVSYEDVGDPQAVDFIKRALHKQKQQRQTMEQICRHSFLHTL